jgi:hypothetical protein
MGHLPRFGIADEYGFMDPDNRWMNDKLSGLAAHAD